MGACGPTCVVFDESLTDYDFGHEHPTVLRERVTSPGGTTAAAVRQLEDHKVRAAFITAMEAARDRSRALASGTD